MKFAVTVLLAGMLTCTSLGVVRSQPSGTVSVTTQLMPDGIPEMVIDPELPTVATERAESKADPSQFTAKLKVPFPPAVVLLMVSDPVWRVLVNSAVSTVASTGLMETVGVEDQPGLLASVTVQFAPNGMFVGVLALPPLPPIVSSWGYPVTAGQATVNLKVGALTGSPVTARTTLTTLIDPY
ncbi:unannotated protein [freshwater metagenome]|uniref:Unannotated protein n=1 Tax=freshwater metagenome TaxID=449393 RepID=A0A6J6ZAK0_9ZZZZ